MTFYAVQATPRAVQVLGDWVYEEAAGPVGVPGVWGDCPDCHGTCLCADDGSMSGVVGAPVPCGCTPEQAESLRWTRQMWEQYRARMDAAVRQWVAFYGLPAGPVDSRSATRSESSQPVDSVSAVGF